MLMSKTDAQSVVPRTGASVSSENLLQMKILGLTIDQMNEKGWGWGTLICLLTSSPGDCLKGKNHWSKKWVLPKLPESLFL